MEASIFPPYWVLYFVSVHMKVCDVIFQTDYSTYVKKKTVKQLFTVFFLTNFIKIE